MKPKKFHRSGPHLPVKNLGQTLAYYRETLGFYDEWTWGEKDGGIRRDDMRLLFAEDPDFARAINSVDHRLPILWFVDHIEAIYSEFRDRNIQFEDPLKMHPYGLKEFAFIDINGYYIRVAEGSE
jgi:hypothetical protein